MNTTNDALTCVYNLLTDTSQYYSLSPREAVIAAYAQSRGDWTTWEYEERYGALVREGTFGYYIGDFSAPKRKG